MTDMMSCFLTPRYELRQEAKALGVRAYDCVLNRLTAFLERNLAPGEDRAAGPTKTFLSKAI